MNVSTGHLRQYIRRRRRQLGLGARYRAAAQLAKKLSATDKYRNSRHIAFYQAVNGELDCLFSLKQAWRDGKCCYLPVMRSEQCMPPLLFARYTPGSLLEKNRYGILEPKDTVYVKPQALDLVITPLVACDGKGNRIGMGGGYYDKSFAFKKEGGSALPWLLGAAYRFQQTDAIMSQPWDVRLDQTIIV